MGANKFSILSRLHVYILIIPAYLMLVLPESMEIALTTQFFGYSLFLPQVLYLGLPFVYVKKGAINKQYLKIILICILGLISGYMAAVNGGSLQIINNFLAGTDFYLTILIFAMFPIAKENFKYLKLPTLLVTLIIALEIILFSFAILSYPSEISSEFDYNGIYRISTTVGGSTGTAVAMFILTGILYAVFKQKYKKNVFLACFAIITITLTRSIILACSIVFLSIFFRKDIESRMSKTPKFLKTLFILVILIVGVVKSGILESFQSRSNALAYGNVDISNGRFDRWEKTYNFIKEYPIYGSGANYVTQQKRARYAKVDCKNLFSPHNTYLLILMERGIIGLVIFLVLLYQLVKNIRFKKITNLSLFFVLILGIAFNTEIVVVFSEFTVLFAVLFLLVREENRLYKINN